MPDAADPRTPMLEAQLRALDAADELAHRYFYRKHSPYCRRDPTWRLRIAELEASLNEDGLARALVLAADLSRKLTAATLVAPSGTTQRERRKSEKREMYALWHALAVKYRRREDGAVRSPRQIAEKIAADDRARDQVTGKAPAWRTVLRRLDGDYPDWAGKP
jgi:hypothetical protein